MPGALAFFDACLQLHPSSPQALASWLTVEYAAILKFVSLVLSPSVTCHFTMLSLSVHPKPRFLTIASRGWALLRAR